MGISKKKMAQIVGQDATHGQKSGTIQSVEQVGDVAVAKLDNGQEMVVTEFVQD